MYADLLQACHRAGFTPQVAAEVDHMLTNINLVAAGNVPGTGALAAGVGTNVVLVPVSPTNGTYTFDQRGAVNPASVYVSYVTNSALPALGYRAIVLLPSGSIQIWTGDTAGNWQLLE